MIIFGPRIIAIFMQFVSSARGVYFAIRPMREIKERKREREREREEIKREKGEREGEREREKERERERVGV
jgi:hypothetical protein